MKKENVELVYDYKNLKTLGFTAGIFSFIRNYRMYRKICRKIYAIKPQTFIAVSYPGINLPLCSYARRIGAKVIYLLPPQIWAWGEFRKYFIKKWTDLVISVFLFEYDFYNQKDIKTIFWQNPLFKLLARYERSDHKKRIGFMPGSRANEIKRNLSVIIEIIKCTVESYRTQLSNIEFVIILHPDSIGDNMFYHFAKKFNNFNPNPLVITDDRYQAMRNCDLIITCSGTASLEASIMGIPQIFFNLPGFFDYYIFRYFLKIREYNLTNLCSGKKIVPSFVMRNRKKLINNIVALTTEYINDPELWTKVQGIFENEANPDDFQKNNTTK